MYKPYQDYCKRQQNSDNYRILSSQKIKSIQKIIDFSTNDYLGLSCHPQVIKSALQAIKDYGVGSTGSRLLSGNHEIFEALETQIALDKKSESALIFNSGFQANSTVLSALLDSSVLGSQALVFCDKLNHASLYQGVFLAQSKMVRYRPQCIEHLKSLLQKYRNDLRPKFIVTETIFGMDGTQVNLSALVDLSREYNAFLYLDEAHATGLVGEKGYGLSTTVDLKNIPYLIMGTFSKALGGFGAYVAGSTLVKNFLINKSAGFIYTTALPLPMIGAAAKAWSLVSHFSKERQTLFERAGRLRQSLQAQGFDTGTSTTPIIPLILGSSKEVLQAQQKLFQQGIRVSAIRPPTVPLGKGRLRLALTLHHTEEDIQNLQKALQQ